MPFARINGIELYYETHGAGPALVFAHGGGGNHLSWWQQIPEFSRSYRCVTFDHRGFGFSREADDGPGAAAFVDDLRGLLDHLEIEKAILVAQSMGGWTVLGFANACPQRVRAIVLCDTPAGIDDPAMRLDLGPAQRGGELSNVLLKALASDFEQRQPALGFLYRQVTGLNIHLKPSALANLMKLKNRVEPVVEHRIPALIIAGEADELTPPRIMEAMARHIPHARLVKVAGAGHSVYWEKAAEFNAILREFVARC